MTEYRTVKLKAITSKIGSGATPRGGSNVYKESGISLIRSQNVYDFEFSVDGLVYIDDLQAKQLANVTIEPEDILLNITGDSIGRCCLVPDEYLPARVNQHVAVIRTTSDAISRFLLYAINNPATKTDLLNRAHDGTRRALTKGIIEEFEVALPPLPIQKRIAEILGRLDDKIEVNRRINRTLEAMAQALYKHWFVDFGPFQDGPFVDSELGPIPEGWEIRSLYDSATYINGAAYRNFQFSEDQTGLPIVKIVELKNGITRQTNFTQEEIDPKYKIDTGEVLFAWSGSPDTSIGIFVWTRGPAWLNQHIFRVLPNRDVETHFVYYMLKHLQPLFIEIARNKQTTGLGHVTKDDLKRLKVVRPSDDVLMQFHVQVGPIYQKWFANEVESLKLAEIRDYLLPKLLSGEVPVTAVEQMAEEASP